MGQILCCKGAEQKDHTSENIKKEAEQKDHSSENIKKEAEQKDHNSENIKKEAEQKDLNSENIMKEAEKKYHNFENIMKEAEEMYKNASREKVGDRLFSGVFLDDKKKKYWVDKKTGHNCFMLSARAMEITWGQDKRYWHWPQIRETSGEVIVVAELLEVCWLEAKVKFDTSNLSPKTTYEISFDVLLKESAAGNFDIIFAIQQPSGEKKEHKQNSSNLTKLQWQEIKIGEFETSNDPRGVMEISLSGTDGLYWKRGLVIKGVIIRNKN